MVFLDVIENFESLVDGTSNIQTVLASRSTLVLKEDIDQFLANKTLFVYSQPMSAILYFYLAHGIDDGHGIVIGLLNVWNNLGIVVG